ncbi:MAG: hypothetical protein II180_08970 [Proteobacteria bacterium]|nr:hypothetical protein [Pseudomonadota bacterium]
MLLLSKYVLDAKPCHTEKTAITWENSTLRTWLNDTFKTTAFTSSEQQQIALTHLENPDNPTYGTNGGNATSDRAVRGRIGGISSPLANICAMVLPVAGSTGIPRRGTSWESMSIRVKLY